MYIVPIILLAVLLIVVYVASSMKKKGSMTEMAYQNLISIMSVVVTIAALIILFMRLRG